MTSGSDLFMLAFFHFVTCEFSSDLRFSFSLPQFSQHSYLAFHSSNSTEVISGLQLRRTTLVILIAKESWPGADRLPVVPLRDCRARLGRSQLRGTTHGRMARIHWQRSASIAISGPKSKTAKPAVGWVALFIAGRALKQSPIKERSPKRCGRRR